MCNYIRLTDITPDWLISGGIFNYLNNFDVPWKDLNMAKELDLDYYGNHSGDKIISPLLKKQLIDGKISEDKMNGVYAVVYYKNFKDWKYLWDAIFGEYNPIENYNMDESVMYRDGVTDNGEIVESKDSILYGRTDTLTKSGTESSKRSGTEEHSYKNSNELTKDGTHTTTTGGTREHQTTQLGASGYQNDYQDKFTNYGETDKYSNYKEGNTTITGTKTDKFTDFGDTLSFNNRTDTNTQSGTDTHSYNKTNTTKTNRHGNIGVTTSQQMIESEIELRKKNFFEIVYKDIDNIMTLDVY